MSYIDRVVKERDDLYEKIVALKAFLATGNFELLTSTNKSLLKGQLDAMQIYHRILNLRLSQ